MDRSASFPSLSAPLISKRRQLYSSIYKWFHSDLAEEGPKLDVSDIVLLLQALGFKLDCFEKSETLSCKSLKVDVSCEKSNMRAILVYPQDYECKCPSKEEHNKGEFWEVSGTGPSASQESNKINESGCSLLPPVPQATSQVIKDIMTYLLKLLKDPSERNHSFNTSNISVQMMATSPASSCNNLNGHSTSRRMSLDSSFLSTVSKNSEFKAPKEVKVESIKIDSLLSLPRQKVWDIGDEKDVSPPQKTSSPVPQLYNSLEQISLNIDKTSDLIGALKNARENIERALKLVSNESWKPLTVSEKSVTPSVQRSSVVKKQYLSPGNTFRSIPYFSTNASPARSKLLSPKLPQSTKKITNSSLTRKVSMSPLNQNNSIKKPGRLQPFKWRSPASSEQTFVKDQNVLRPATPSRAGSSSSGSRESLTKSLLTRPIMNVKRRISPEANNKSSFSSPNLTNSAKKNTSISSKPLVSNKNLTNSAKKPAGSSKIAKPIRGGASHTAASVNDTSSN